MERNSEHQTFLFNNNGGTFDDTNTNTNTAFDAMFSGVSLLSLLTANFHLSPPPTMSHLFTEPLPLPLPPLPLPPLLSLDHPLPLPRAAANKRARVEPSHRSFRSPVTPRASALQRQRRQRLGEKTRCLQRVLPWDTKMDMATMLEETYKYVKFLQAQLVALSAMPVSGYGGGGGGGEGLFGGLERLSRNQLLQVLVNSPVAQTSLYSKGFCVFSVEQLGLIEKVSQMRRLRNGSFLVPNHHF